MKINTKFFISLQIILVLLTIIAIFSSFGFNMYQTGLPEASYIKNVKLIINGVEKDTTLPYTLTGITSETPVTVRAYIYPKKEDFIYVKTAYTPATVYTDDIEIYKFGKKETYPAFMRDPATEVFIAEPAVRNKKTELKIEFLSPKTRGSMTIYPPIIGSIKSIFQDRITEYRYIFLLAIVEIGTSISLIVISFILKFFEKKISLIFFWLGIFALTSGVWAFGESTLTALVIKNPTFLYLCAFLGLFTLTVPLIHLTLASVDFKNPKPLYIISAFITIAAILSLILQLLGIYPLSSSMYAFHIINPCALSLLLFFILYEAFKNDSLQAKRFILPIMILAISALIEVTNYYFRFTYKLASLFQYGILLFILVMGFIIGFYTRDTAKIKNDNEKLTSELEFIRIQMDEQRKYNELIANSEKALKKQRHDLRHHLITIKELADSANGELDSYINSLIDNVPKPQERYCENTAVNAIISHYAAICKDENITFTTRLVVPNIENAGFNSELSVIFGNLLENATYACRKTDNDKRFIRICSGVRYDTFVITMDNSYDGNFISVDGRFRSTKRDGFGIGLSSIQSVARKYHGDAKFEGKGEYFQSSVYMSIEGI